MKNPAPDYELSVVVIARNEEKAIQQTLEAITRETDRLQAEILLVDSASTDRTVPIATGFPVRILRLEPSPFLSPAAGRYLGTVKSTGRYVLFLDGDMVLAPGWLEAGFRQLGDPSVGGVTGRLYWVYPGEDITRNHPDTLPTGSVRTLGGAGMYRREALDRCGTFNPYIKGEEEVEIGHRMRAGGFTLVRLDTPIAYHLEKPRTQSSLDQKAGYFAGHGQFLRAYPLTATAVRLVWGSRHIIVQHAYFFGLPLLSIILALLGYPIAAMVTAGILLAGLTAMVLLKGGRKLYLHIRQLLLILANIVKGLLRGLPDAAGFEQRVRWEEIQGVGGVNPSGIRR